MPSLEIDRISFEHHPDGFGVDSPTPRLSWSFSSHDQNFTDWFQTSYDIQVGRSTDKDLSTHHVESSESILVPWPGAALRSRESAWIRVRSHGRAKDSVGKEINVSTAWSKTVTVENARLDQADWTARLITSSLASKPDSPIRPVLFRRVFSLPESFTNISKARLYITAHGLYSAYINGHRIGDHEMAPGWTSYHHRLNYQVFDITAVLKPDSANVLGVEVAEGWFAGRLGWADRRCLYGDRLGFLAQLEISSESGDVFKVQSNADWKSSHGAITRSEIYDGEDFDSRLEQIGWHSDPAFDQTSWLGSEEMPFPSAKLQVSESPPVRATQTLRPIKIWTSSGGRLLIDFGQNLTGKLSVRLPIYNSMEGRRITFGHVEVLEHGEPCTRTLRTAKPVDSVILSKAQPTIWSPKFTFHGFRFVQIDGWPAQLGLPAGDDITAVVLHSDMVRTGWFSCSDTLVNQLHENVVWSMRGNTLSIPTDCPQRDERLGWTGDIQVFAPTASFLYDVSCFLASWLADFAAEQHEDGRKGAPGVVVPDIIGLPPDPPDPQCAWHDAAVLTPWDVFLANGDVELLRSQYASMKTWVDLGIPRAPNGLWDPNVWQYGDWLDPSAPPDEPGRAATDCVMVADAYLYRVLKTLSQVSMVLGMQEAATRYSNEAAKVKATFQHEYITPAGLLVGDTQTGHALALEFGLYDRDDQMSKSADRLAHLVHLGGYRIFTGFVGTPLIAHALSDTGSHQLAYRMLLEKECPSWLYPITMDATTIWERWDSMLPDGSINPGTMTSFNHYALGSVANWLHKNVAGISPLEAGWRKFKVRPVPGGTITHAKGRYNSPYGRIECSWHIDQVDGKFHLSLMVPPNSTAVVILPSAWKRGVKDTMEESFEVGSGSHDFSCYFQQDEWPPRARLRRSTFRLDTGSASGIGGIIVSVMMQQLNQRHPNNYLIAMRLLWIPIGLLILFWIFIPESPWHHVRRGEKEKAMKCLRRLYGGVEGYDFQMIALSYYLFSAELPSALLRVKTGPFTFLGNSLLGIATCYATPPMLLHMSLKAAFVYGAFSVPICVLLWLYVPETKGGQISKRRLKSKWKLWCRSRGMSSKLERRLEQLS